jgi:tellurite resistance protein TerA
MKLQEKPTTHNLKDKTNFYDVTIPLKILMKWDTAIDLDLAAAYETKKGKTGLVYFGDKGNINTFPYMRLGEDCGIGDIISDSNNPNGGNQEAIHINEFKEMKYVYIFCWDYPQVRKGEDGRFKGSNIEFTVSTETKTYTIETYIDNINLGNTCCVAYIEEMEDKIQLISCENWVGTLHRLKNLEQLIGIVRKHHVEKPTEPTLSFDNIIRNVGKLIDIASHKARRDD